MFLRKKLSNQFSKARLITGLAYTGSAAIVDTKLDVQVGGRLVADDLGITTAAAAIDMDDLLPCRIFVPANQSISASISASPTTNSAWVGVRTAPVFTRRFRRRFR